MVDWIKGAIVIGCCTIAIGIKYFWPNYPDDNPVEECAEEIIKQQTSLSFDSTPYTKEHYFAKATNNIFK